jgi:hypothetical protein
MAGWTRVKWSEARQVIENLGPRWTRGEAEGAQAPQVYFEALREAGRRADAARFLSQALPRLEAVAWAARTVRDLTPQDADRSSPEARALRAALLWVSDPTEPRRRAAYEAARQAKTTTPEYLCALAVFFSGGSIAPETSAPVAAHREAAGRFAAVAVISAATRSPDSKAAFDRALDAGAVIAREGLEPASA